MGCQREFYSDPSASVHLEKEEGAYQLIRHGQPFKIKGASGAGSLRKLKAIGGNTIRLYDTLNLQSKLDSAGKYGIAVIVDLPIPKSQEDHFYEDEQEVKRSTERISATVKKFANHPALLMWNLGNELLYYDLSDRSFSSAFNNMLAAIKANDPNHPVGTATAFIGDRQSINYRIKFPELDVLLINSFGSVYRVGSALDRYEDFWDIPFIISEFGEQGPWEVQQTHWGAPLELNSSEKARRLKFVYEEQMPVNHPRYLGALAFYWGQHQEVTHTWFNFFSEQGQTNAAYYSLAEIYGSPMEGNRPPEVETLILNESRDSRSFLFQPGEELSALLKTSDPDGDSLSIQWQVFPEDWFFKTGERPPQIKVEFKTTNNGEAVKFQAPKKPGPYRLFAKITDNHNHFATANLAFYVVP